MRRYLLAILAVATIFALPGRAEAAGGSYTIDGGTPAEQAQVRAALQASSFDWSVLPSIAVHIAPGGSYATPGQVYLDPAVLDMGEFGWATVQHEFGHEIDFELLDDAKRAELQQALGATEWSYGDVMELGHSDYGCERFASEVSWAYWESPENALRPQQPGDEAGFMPPAAFRALLSQLLGVPNPPGTTTPPPSTKAYAPALKKKVKSAR